VHGIAAITYPLIDAWARLTDRDPEPFDVELLLRLDVAFRATVADG
jgi:hypothetical protein